MIQACYHILLFMHAIKMISFQIGHVTKTGDIAGPRMLEHIVDTVLYMEASFLSFNDSNKLFYILFQLFSQPFFCLSK